jgi:hypothetical protein
MNALAPGWFPDPTGRHEFRWWTGAAWGDQVADHGQSSVDGMQSPVPPVAVAAASPPPVYQQPGGYQQALPYARATAPASAGAAVGWGTLAGAAVAGLSVVLNWLDAPGSSGNAFDVPVAFLADYTTDAGTSFNVGLVVLVLAAVALASAFIRQPAWRLVGRVAGSALVVIGVAYVIQLYRLADAASVSVSDILGVAPFAAIAGGATVLVARGR